MKRLSVVIPNYNYEQFVGAAIESALAIDWPDVEVIVVDDGSTDSSLDAIRSYADQVHVIARPNETQRVAVNHGLAAASGDVVVILDSDDLLPPDVAQRMAGVWTPQVSKVQFRMQRIDASGQPIGKPFPELPRDVEPYAFRSWLLRTTAYPTPPGSGNAYARWFIDLMAPIGPDAGDFADSVLLAAAPVLGDVVQVPDVIVGYRQHSANDSALMLDTARFEREVQRARARWRVVRQIALSERLHDRTLRRSRELLQLRVAAHVVTPRGTRPHEDRRTLVIDAIRSPIAPGPESIPKRGGIMAWCLCTLILPRRLANRLLRLRYAR